MAGLVGGTVCAVAAARSFEIVIRNGTVVDGTGRAAFRADVGISDGRIVAVGPIAADEATGEVIDAHGLYVAPGFIDGHSHAAPALTRAEQAGVRNLLTQGVTTVFINPDGGGPAELAPQLAAIRAAGPAVNVAPLIGHNAVRIAVLGYENRDPTPAELEKMQALVRAGMQAGAFGLSSGPFYTPGNFSKTPELVALARVAGEAGGFYTSHVRDESDYGIGVVAAIDEVITVAREAKLPGIVTHIKALGPGVWGRSAEIVRRIDAARADGVAVWADQYPYDASSTSLSAALLPPWVNEGGKAAMRARLMNPALREKIRAAVTQNLRRRGGAAAIQICEYRPEPQLEGQRLNAIAAAKKMSPEDAAIELLARGSAGIVSFNMSEEDIVRFMQQPWTMTCSDGEVPVWGEGAPHPRSYGTFPRKIRRYVVERPVLTLEQAVHAMTGLPAQVFGLRERGVVRAGAWADVVVFDLAALRDTASYEHPHAYAEGVVHVFVNGVAALENGAPTAARAGRVLARGH